MAGEKISYPMLPAKNWWALRKKFQGSLPTAVTPGYIAPVLGMNEKSASNNVLPYLRTMGLIDDKGKPTERANAWRIDEKYPEVCNEIKSEIYDQELLDAFPGQIENRVSVEQWFLSKTGVGKVAASDGTEIWTQTYDKGGNEYGKEITTMSTGGYAVAGYDGTIDAWILRLNKYGQL